MVVTCLFLISIISADPYKAEVAKLGSAKFAIRRAAHRALYEGLPDSISALQKYGIRSYDSETRMRSIQILKQYASNIRPSRQFYLPWIEFLPKVKNREAVIEKVVADVISEFGIEKIDEKDKEWMHRWATRMYIRRMLFSGKSPKEIVIMLDEMAEAERGWRRTNEGFPWQGEK